MLNHKWQKDILRAKPTNTSEITNVSGSMIDGENTMTNTVKNNEKLMKYLSADNTCGHTHNMDMLVASLNVNQHLREAVLNAELIEDESNNMYVIKFPFGSKTIEYKLNKKVVDNE